MTNHLVVCVVNLGHFHDFSCHVHACDRVRPTRPCKRTIVCVPVVDLVRTAVELSHVRRSGALAECVLKTIEALALKFFQYGQLCEIEVAKQDEAKSFGVATSFLKLDLASRSDGASNEAHVAQGRLLTSALEMDSDDN